MPEKHIALLRGINVGRAKRIAMADLRALVEGLGYTEVRTLLNSGNVVFGVPARVRGDHAARIERALATRVKLSSRVTVLRASEIATIVDGDPLRSVARDPSRYLVGFLADPKDRARLRPLLKSKWHPEALALGERVAYLWCADGILASPMATAVNREMGDGITARNWATLLKLHALASEA